MEKENSLKVAPNPSPPPVVALLSFNKQIEEYLYSGTPSSAPVVCINNQNKKGEIKALYKVPLLSSSLNIVSKATPLT